MGRTRERAAPAEHGRMETPVMDEARLDRRAAFMIANPKCDAEVSQYSQVSKFTRYFFAYFTEDEILLLYHAPFGTEHCSAL